MVFTGQTETRAAPGSIPPMLTLFLENMSAHYQLPWLSPGKPQRHCRCCHRRRHRHGCSDERRRSRCTHERRCRQARHQLVEERRNTSGRHERLNHARPVVDDFSFLQIRHTDGGAGSWDSMAVGCLGVPRIAPQSIFKKARHRPATTP